MKKLRQIFAGMKRQPVIAWVTLTGTALSVFLFMISLIINNINMVPFSPESNRGRIYYGIFQHMDLGMGSSSSGHLTYPQAKMFYKGLDGVERESFLELYPENGEAVGTTKISYQMTGRRVDEIFWKIYDFKLLNGRYFNKEELASNMPVALVTKSTSRKLFGRADAVGETFEYELEPYRVVGVVEDVSPLATAAFGDAFLPLSVNDTARGTGVAAALLLSKGTDPEEIRRQVKARYAEQNATLAPDSVKYVYHQAPYDQETFNTAMNGSNVDPDIESVRLGHWILYSIMLLVPAINLSSMLNSRLRQRVSEFGIRIAYGCTRTRIITDILVENFIVTLAGGLIGTLLAIIFALIYPDLFVSTDFLTPDYGVASPSLSMLISWPIVLGAIGACFILNLISASVPAWKASRISPVNAISGHND